MSLNLVCHVLVIILITTFPPKFPPSLVHTSHHKTLIYSHIIPIPLPYTFPLFVSPLHCCVSTIIFCLTWNYLWFCPSVPFQTKIIETNRNKNYRNNDNQHGIVLIKTIHPVLSSHSKKCKSLNCCLYLKGSYQNQNVVSIFSEI